MEAWSQKSIPQARGVGEETISKELPVITNNFNSENESHATQMESSSEQFMRTYFLNIRQYKKFE